MEALRRRGVACDVLDAPTAEDGARLARAVVDGGAERLVCVGGDGVVRIGVGATAETGCVLGIVPDGTGNDFARALGLLDGSLDDAVVRALADPIPVDAIRTDHGWAASVATLGFSGDVTARANAMRWPRGGLRYTIATLRQLPRLRTLSLVLDVDGRRAPVDTTLLAIGNTAYFGGGMRICPDAAPTDGRLQVVSIGAVPRRTFVRVFPRVFSGRHVDHRAVTVDAGTRVQVTGVGDVWADGDRLGALGREPTTFEAVPGAISVAGASV